MSRGSPPRLILAATPGVVPHQGCNYPAFLEHFHKLFAKCQNALRGRWENFWSSEQTSVVRLVDPGDIVDKMVYAICNPVKDNLVEKAHHWPGASSLDALMHGKLLVASRPRHFFRDEGAMPDVVSLSISRPTPFKELSQKEFAAMVEERIRAVEQAVASECQRSRRSDAKTSMGEDCRGKASFGARREGSAPQSYTRQTTPSATGDTVPIRSTTGSATKSRRRRSRRWSAIRGADRARLDPEPIADRVIRDERLHCPFSHSVNDTPLNLLASGKTLYLRNDLFASLRCPRWHCATPPFRRREKNHIGSTY
jgi:hypothetical protein